MLQRIRKWVAIRSYVKGLGPKLQEAYGRQAKYSPTQVIQTIRDGGFSPDFSCFALSLFCDRHSFDDYHQFFGRACDYDAMRTELAGRFFDGDASFAAVDVIPEVLFTADSNDATDSGVSDWGDDGGCDSDGGDGGSE